MTNPLTLNKFKAWVNEQPRGTKFDFVDIEVCAVAQYLKAQGHIDVTVGASVFYYGPVGARDHATIPIKIQDAMNRLFDGDGKSRIATFGQLAKELEAV